MDKIKQSNYELYLLYKDPKSKAFFKFPTIGNSIFSTLAKLGTSLPINLWGAKWTKNPWLLLR